MEPNPGWLFEYSITHIKRHHLFFNESLRDRAAIVRTEPLLIELYNSRVSTCSQKVRMALWEKEISWQDRTIVFQKNDHLSDWYLAINPNGVVPALVHDGNTIIDSSVINEYLEDVF
jgi:hypothetical protein